MDPEWWDDPESKADVSEPDVLPAALICEQCPVRRKCLDEALRPLETRIELSEQHSTRNPGTLKETEISPWACGIWGATTYRERRKALRTTRGPEAASEKLEAELPARIDRRIRAWKMNVRSSVTAGLIEPLLRARREAS
jgi:hypothetical protein